MLFSFREAYGKPQVAEESDSEKVAEESDSEKVKKFLIDKYIRYINDKGIKFPPIEMDMINQLLLKNCYIIPEISLPMTTHAELPTIQYRKLYDTDIKKILMEIKNEFGEKMFKNGSVNSFYKNIARKKLTVCVINNI